jgi:hypothetical protein
MRTWSEFYNISFSYFDLKRMKITGWRVKAEDRQEWSRIVEQNKSHPGL